MRVAITRRQFLYNCAAGTASLTALPLLNATTAASDATVNYGGTSFMKLKLGSDYHYAFIKATVTGAVGTVTSAKLKIRTDEAIDNISVYAVTGTWDESTITYNKMGTDLTWGSLQETKSSLTGPTWYEFDVSGMVTGDGTYTFGLKTTYGSAKKISSKESANDPVLLVETNGGE